MNSWGENAEGLRGWVVLAEWLAGMMVLGVSSRLVCLTKVTGELLTIIILEYTNGYLHAISHNIF